MSRVVQFGGGEETPPTVKQPIHTPAREVSMIFQTETNGDFMLVAETEGEVEVVSSQLTNAVWTLPDAENENTFVPSAYKEALKAQQKKFPPAPIKPIMGKPTGTT